MAARKTVAVDARDLRDAFDFVSAGEVFDHSAYISLDTGKIYWRSTDADLQEGDLPDDLDDPDQYLAVPSQRELGLGRRLSDHSLSTAVLALPDPKLPFKTTEANG